MPSASSPPALDRDALWPYLAGASLAFDPLPARRRRTFIASDEDAMRADWEKVAGDMEVAFAQAGTARRQDKKR